MPQRPFPLSKALEVQLSQSLRQVENLESMRIHLHDCPGDPGAAEHSIDWAPLERLLSQGPVSHSLLHIICDSLKILQVCDPCCSDFCVTRPTRPRHVGELASKGEKLEVGLNFLAVSTEMTGEQLAEARAE